MFNVLEISRMTTHNGPGYRTNVFFMGCSLRCRWCSTPESQTETGLGFNPGKCIGCTVCTQVCPTGAMHLGPSGKPELDRNLCTLCFACTKECYAQALWKYGKPIQFDDLLKEILADEPFFRNSGGGATFSGGECLLHVNDEFVELFAEIKRHGITIAVDTCGNVPRVNLERVMPYVDYYLYDIKKLDSSAHKELTGCGNELILSNLEYLDSHAEGEIYIRYPLIPGLNDSESDIIALCEYVHTLKRVKEIDFLPFHHMGRSRYQFSGKEYLMGDARRQSNEKLAEIVSVAESAEIPWRIIG